MGENRREKRRKYHGEDGVFNFQSTVKKKITENIDNKGNSNGDCMYDSCQGIPSCNCNSICGSSTIPTSACKNRNPGDKHLIQDSVPHVCNEYCLRRKNLKGKTCRSSRFIHPTVLDNQSPSNSDESQPTAPDIQYTANPDKIQPTAPDNQYTANPDEIQIQFPFLDITINNASCIPSFE